MADERRTGGEGIDVAPVEVAGKFVQDAEEVVEDAAVEVVPKVSFFALFRFADLYDYLLMTLAFLGAVGDGSSFAIMLAVLGTLINSFGSHSNGTSQAEFNDKVIQGTLNLTYIAAGTFVCSFLEAACALRTADRQASKMRATYLQATLRQDVGFFDTAGASVAEVVNSVGTDTLVVQDAVGEKIGNFVMNTSSFVSGFAVAFYLEWRLAMVLLAFLPVLMIPGLLYGRALIGLARHMHAATNKAAAVAEESLSAIRTVYSFVGEQRTLTAYSKALDLTVQAGLKMGLAKGLATGANGVTFILWAVMAWYGSLLIINRGLGGGTVLVCGLAAMMGGLGLGTALPNLRYIAEAQMAAHKMFTTIDRVPGIDSENMSGQTPEKVTGTLELRNVRFAYPSRPKQIIFEDFSLVIPTGKTVALVGSSGSGKSTVIALLERYYDPLGGAVLVDGVDIKDLQLRWLRMQIGLVSQEPSLFATTIKENILYGKDGASMDEVVAAAQAANAHTFISGLPLGYDTMVGEKGVQMSGGQKQRIAIARALLKNPPILLLDEATSALDSESERVVQVALDQVSVGRTTVVVAHRLSTIRTADMIAVVHGGRVVETGSHEELLQNDGGAYSALVNIQNSRPQDRILHVAAADATENSPSVTSAFQLRSSSSKRNSSSFRRDASVRRSLSVHSSGDATKAADEMTAKPPSIGRLLKLNRPEWKQAILGSIGAAGFGFVQPLYAFTMGSMVGTFFEQDHDKMRTSIRNFSLIFTALAIGCLFTNVTRDYNFASMGERLTKRVRELILTRVMTYEVAWFDEDDHSSSAVCSQLNTDAAVVRSLVGDRMSLLVQTGAAVLLACIIGLVVAWPLAIVMIVTQPITILCFYGKKVLQKSMSQGNLKSQARSTLVASEAVSNHRTITAFHSQKKMCQRFNATQASLKRGARMRAMIAGLGLGLAQSLMLGTWAFYFWYGAKLINEGKITFEGMFKVFFVLVSTGRMIAEAGSATSDLAKGSQSAAAIFGILDRSTRIKAEEGSLERVEGQVELKDVHFAYPMRPEVMVFKGFSLKVQAATSIALVGQSGSGKSTIIGLIERFYDPLQGAVYIDGRNLRTLPLKTVRRHIGLVSQEPTLFAGTIRENILYGKEDASEAELIEAAKAANAHTFICGLSSGYDTNTGERGLQLSGGQKQRIAIARAIIKNPGILLLDEATSALDSQSEKVVQDALDRMMVGRTTIVVAHRLSTIQNANSIAVIQEGSIHEQGRHNDLMAKRGAYFELVKLQSKNY